MRRVRLVTGTPLGCDIEAHVEDLPRSARRKAGRPAND
jgi:hypothetical protein